MWEGVQSYLPFHPVRVEPFASPALLPSLRTVAPKDFQVPVLGISIDREPAGSVSCPPAAFPPATLSLEPPNSLFYWYQLYGPCSGTPLGPPAGFLAHLPAVALSASALGAVASCGVGAHGGQPLDRPMLIGLGLEAGWGRFSWYSLTLGPYKIGCSQPHYFNKNGAILI